MKDQHVLVLGLGASGLAMARWCARSGARVIVADTREAPPQLGALREALPDTRFVPGPFTDALLEGVSAVYRSPGLTPAQVGVVFDAAAVHRGRFSELVTWTASLSEDERSGLASLGFTAVDPEDAARGCPCVLVRAANGGPSTSEWVIEGRPVLDSRSWDVRVLYSMRG